MMFPTVRMLRQATAVIFRQQQQIVFLQREVTACELAYMRISRDLIEQFLISLDEPENQDVIRDRLSCSLGFYRNKIAVREEHV